MELSTFSVIVENSITYLFGIAKKIKSIMDEF